MSPAYGESSYWDERYSREPSAFDWYAGYARLKSIIDAHCPKTGKVLQVGVGTSRLQEDMVRMGGYKSITNIDISSVAIQHMRELHKAMPELSYRVMDVRSMDAFPTECFDAILDKGTLDAILCGDNSGEKASAMLFQCHRVLKPSGAFVVVTYGEPLSRLIYMEGPHYDWDTQVYAVAKPDAAEGLLGIGEHPAEYCGRPAGGEGMAAVIKGPFEAANLDLMESLSALEQVHFVYVMKKLDAETIQAGLGGRQMKPRKPMRAPA